MLLLHLFGVVLRSPLLGGEGSTTEGGKAAALQRRRGEAAPHKGRERAENTAPPEKEEGKTAASDFALVRATLTYNLDRNLCSKSVWSVF